MSVPEGDHEVVLRERLLREALARDLRRADGELQFAAINLVRNVERSARPKGDFPDDYEVTDFELVDAPDSVYFGDINPDYSDDGYEEG